MLKSFLIAPYEVGEQTNLKPWLLPESAFAELEDAYVWRGRVVKRFGTALMGETPLASRFRVNLGDTDGGTGNFSTTVPGAIFGVGQMFSIGEVYFTVNATGTPATLLTTGTATGTYDTTTGALTITGNNENPATPVYFYPAEPVMGLRLRENLSLSSEDTIGFDTQFAYTRLGGAWERLGSQTWTSSNTQFFWSVNYRAALASETNFYVTNYNSTDNIQYITQGSSTWNSLRPQLDSGASRFLDTALILIPYKDRLLALNTIETDGGSKTFQNRCRFSQNGDPTDTTNGWIDDTPGRGGFIDAPTSEAIVTASFIKDQLIVYFERSTWQLVYTANAVIPFTWQQINTELGAESTFSAVTFDRGVLGVGNVGVHSCNGTNVTRIDEAIPDSVFQIHNGSDGVRRVYGIRDFYREVVYWTFPDQLNSPTFPTRVLLYNYQNASWAFINDSFTCFGYLQSDSTLTWATVGQVFPTWRQWNTPWQSPISQSNFPDVIAGNQEGFTFILRAQKSANSQSLYLTDMTPTGSILTVINHNLKEGDYILVSDAEGITELNDVIVKVRTPITVDTFAIDTPFSGTYTGAGYLTRVSNINILTKQFNPGTPVGQQFRFPYIDFLLDRTVNGEVTVDYLTNTSSSSLFADGFATQVIQGNNILFTRPEESGPSSSLQAQIWHRFYVQAQAAFIQLRIFLTHDQITNREIAFSDFELNAVLLYVRPAGRVIG